MRYACLVGVLGTALVWVAACGSWSDSTARVRHPVAPVAVSYPGFLSIGPASQTVWLTLEYVHDPSRTSILIQFLRKVINPASCKATAAIETAERVAPAM